jgi:hypothetical protein
MNIKINKLVFITSLFSIHLIPFAKSISIETLPILLLLFCYYIYLSTDQNIFNYIDKNRLIFLLIVYIVLFYSTHYFGGYNNIIELGKYLVGPIIFLFFTRLKKFFGLDEFIVFGFFIIILFLISDFRLPIIFKLTCGVYEFFISRVDCSTAGLISLNRSPLITPEPSYLSLLLSYYLIVLYSFKQKIATNDMKKNIISFLEVAILYIIINTQSRIGIFFSLIYILFYIIKYNIYKNIYAYFIPIFLLFIIFGYNSATIFSGNYTKFDSDFSLITSRSLLNIDRIIDYYIVNSGAPMKGLLAYINNFEPTGFIRILHNYLSVVGSIKNNFIGNGLGSYSSLWYEYAIEASLVDLLRFNEVTRDWYNPELARGVSIYDKKQYVQNYMFAMLHDGGLIPIILILTIMFKATVKVIKNKYNFGYVILAYLFVSFFFQSPLTSPYPWLALAMIYYNDREYA